jgi:FkbM family methyltransferase
MSMTMIRKTYKDGFVLELVDYYELLHEYGSYENSEPQTEDWVVDHVGDDWVIFDCGAHIGYYTMLFSHCAPSGRVYAFEAGGASHEKCLRNLAHNAQRFGYDFTNVEVLRVAVGDRNERGVEEVLYLSGTPDYGKTRGRFDFITLDAFCAKRGIDRLDLIKSDVDGWDYEVLLGARESIRRFRPIVVAEVNYALEWRDHSPEDVARFLDEMDYAHDVLDCPGPTNWVMIPRERYGDGSLIRRAGHPIGLTVPTGRE